MENPEEILHSLEEYAKMKPKDIPRELEEYLKLVAKTGDPIYQWSAIKSLFREKFINVITEFYESCTSMEIPPCPNVEMFNYDLMKNFILEKLDTFASAPFTLQRICELLTSPRKEYSRIDKYMRALEKNILVVSTMEPGGRRTENGEGIMNGIESDHEHVHEPGNEINVEEMYDSHYTTNHLELCSVASYNPVSDDFVDTHNSDIFESTKSTASHVTENIASENPISDDFVDTHNSDIFESTKSTASHVTENIASECPITDDFVDTYNSDIFVSTRNIEIDNCVDKFTSDDIFSDSTTSQEKVCVGNAQILIEVTKEADDTVTITAINVKDDDQDKKEIVEDNKQTEAVITESNSRETEDLAESINKPDDVEIKSEIHMETEPVNSSAETPMIGNTEILPLPISEDTLSSTTMSDKLAEELNQPRITSESETVAESGDNESVSPETSITSSDDSPCESSIESNASVKVPPSNLNTEVLERSVIEPVKNLDEPINKESENVEKDMSDAAVDSTTEASGDDKIECDSSKETDKGPNEIEIPDDVPQDANTKCGIRMFEVHSTDNDKLDDKYINEATFKTDVLVPTLPDESVKPDQEEEIIDVSEQKVEEPAESKIEEVSSHSQEKETPMEVDAAPEDVLELDTKLGSPVKEPESSEPPENP